MGRRFLTPASSYDELWRQVDYRTLEIPERFNLGVACLDDQDPDALALVEVQRDRTHRNFTFGDVKERSNRLANALAALGIGQGDVVGLVKPASIETAVSYMSIFRMGAVALPLSSLFGPDALAFRLKHGEAKAVITAIENVAKVREALGGSGVPIIVIGGEPGPGEHGFDAIIDAASAEFTPVDTAAEDPVFLIYTSGTTGDPKGALHAQRIVFGHIPAFEAVYDFYPQEGDRIWSPADWAWIAGLMDIFVPGWWFGIPVVVDLEPAYTAERAIWLMREHAVTLTLLPPTALRALRASGIPGGDFAMRAVCSGAEPLGADMFIWCTEFFGDRCIVNEGFGQTELNACIGNCQRVFPAKAGSLGKGLPGTTAVVLDDEGNPVVNQIGEIGVDRHHPNTLLEYWRNPEATKDKFHGDWLLTGDLGEMDDDGYIWFKSRKDDLIKSSGYRIGPGEIEGCLGSHDAVAVSAVIGVPDERRGQAIKAFVVLREGVTASDEVAEALKHHVRTRLAPHEVPREIVFLDDLPKTNTGKIMRRALRDL